MRVDKWIWAVRMVKSRTLAGEMCKKGKVTVNGNLVKPSKSIVNGDTVEVVYKDLVRRYEVVNFLEKRVGAEVAKDYYKDLYPVETQKGGTEFDSEKMEAESVSREKGLGRPTKKDRRQIEEFIHDC